jgi:hypothetical protein
MNRKLVQILKRATFLYTASQRILGTDAPKTDVQDLAYRLWNAPNTKIASLVRNASEVMEDDYEDEDELDEDLDEACGKMGYDSEDDEDDYYASDDEDCEDGEDEDEETDLSKYASMLSELDGMDDDLIHALINEDDDEEDDESEYEDDEEDDEEEESEEDSECEDDEDCEEEDSEDEEDDEEDEDEESEEDLESSKCATDEEIFGRVSSEEIEGLSFMDHEEVDPYAEGEADSEIEAMLASGCGARNKKASMEEDLFFDEKTLERELTETISKRASQQSFAESQYQFDNNYEGDEFFGAEKGSMIDDFLSGNLENKMELRSAINKSASTNEEYVAESLISMDPVDDPMAPVATPERPRVKKASQGAKTLGSIIASSSEEDEMEILGKLWPKKPDISKLING